MRREKKRVKAEEGKRDSKIKKRKDAKKRCCSIHHELRAIKAKGPHTHTGKPRRFRAVAEELEPCEDCYATSLATACNVAFEDHVIVVLASRRDGVHECSRETFRPGAGSQRVTFAGAIKCVVIAPFLRRE